MNNQRGSTLILMVAFAAVLMGSLIYVSSIYFGSTLDSLNRQRRRLVALQVLQDFAALAQKANDLYYYGGSACVAPFANSPTAASPFCFNAAAANCVRNPHDGAAGISQFCMTDVPATMGVSSIIIQPQFAGPLDRMVAIYRSAFAQRYELLAAIELDALRHLNSWFGQTANAQRTYYPSLAGAPTELITPIACPPAAVQCKVCAAGLDCIELQVCTNPAGCGVIASGLWYRQVVGILPRS